MFVSSGVFIQIPVHPSHHIATLPGATFSFSISSTSHVPHSGNVLMIQFSLVISSTLLIASFSFTALVFYLLFLLLNSQLYVFSRLCFCDFIIASRLCKEKYKKCFLFVQKIVHKKKKTIHGRFLSLIVNCLPFYYLYSSNRFCFLLVMSA